MNFIRIIIFMILFVRCASGQSVVDIKLTLVQKQFHNKLEHGLLIDVHNTSDTNLAFYLTTTEILRWIKFYKKNSSANNYEEIIHPVITEMQRESFIQDSIYKNSGILVDFFGEDYNSRSLLYREFTEIDSL